MRSKLLRKGISAERGSVSGEHDYAYCEPQRAGVGGAYRAQKDFGGGGGSGCVFALNTLAIAERLLPNMLSVGSNGPVRVVVR